LYVSAGVALLTPFTDTIYLPALTSVKDSLQASDASVALTVSLYLAAVGLGQICFGPLSDRFGRLPVIFGCLIFYEIITVPCIFAPSILWLIFLRTLQGFCVSGTIVSAQAAIADIYEEAERGGAMGIFLAPMLIGPVIAPLIGGILSAVFSWRATFVALAAMAVPIFIITIITVPETHHWHATQRIIKQNSSKFSLSDEESLDLVEQQLEMGNVPSTENVETTIERSESNQANSSKKSNIPLIDESLQLSPLMMPWEPLQYLCDSKLRTYYILVGTTFAPMFTSLTILPLFLAAEPYNLSSAIIGTTYLPVGISMLLGSLLGGILSDMSQQRYPQSVDGRMSLLLPVTWIVPASTVVFGFALQYQQHLGLILTSQSVLGLGQAMLMPSTMSYLSSVYPTRAGSLGSVLLFLCFASAAVCVSVSVEISNQVGVAYFFVIVASINCVSQLWTSLVNSFRLSQVNKEETSIRNQDSNLVLTEEG